VSAWGAFIEKSAVYWELYTVYIVFNCNMIFFLRVYCSRIIIWSQWMGTQGYKIIFILAEVPSVAQVTYNYFRRLPKLDFKLRFYLFFRNCSSDFPHQNLRQISQGVLELWIWYWWIYKQTKQRFHTGYIDTCIQYRIDRYLYPIRDI